MATEIKADGEVVAPRNITAPTPILSLRGFNWGTVDEKIPDSLPSQVKQRLTEQAPLIAGATHAFESKATVPRSEPLAPQLSEQLHGHSLDAPEPPPFPLTLLQGSFAGNGFNTIFRPRSKFPLPKEKPLVATVGPDDNILELNLTLEQWTFGQAIGDIPNRGLGEEPDIVLKGLPYLQTVQDVTNELTGRGDDPRKVDIHFEPGMWLFVPPAKFQKDTSSVVRMASIPHGTTINAQGLAPNKVPGTITGGVKGAPKFDPIDTTPFKITGEKFDPNPFKDPMDASKQGTFRLPQNLDPFNDKGTKLITTEIIKNPHMVLEKAINGQDIAETITFEVSTGPPTAKLNGGGTANISFLAGKQEVGVTSAPGKGDNPTAHAAFMKSTFWIERVNYKVNVPPVSGQALIRNLIPTMPEGSTAPTPKFDILTPPGGIPKQTTITVPGTQIQYSQTVNLNFGAPPNANPMLTWPHVSVATIVPTESQFFQMK